MAEILADIGYFALSINLILLIIGFFRYGKAYKIFAIYMGAMFIIQMLSNVLNYLAIHNLYLSHFYFILQFVLLSLFYLSLLKEKSQRNVVKMGLVLGLTALLLQYINNPPLFFKFNLFEIFITSFLLIIYATFHFYNLLSVKREFYYINMGILIYLFGSTVLFLAGNLVASLTDKTNRLTWGCNAFLYIVYQLFIFIELRIFTRETKKTTTNETDFLSPE